MRLKDWIDENISSRQKPAESVGQYRKQLACNFWMTKIRPLAAQIPKLPQVLKYKNLEMLKNSAL